jgi:hypothetical protein
MAEETELRSISNTASGHGTAAQRTRENLVLVLFNHNDFVTVR